MTLDGFLTFLTLLAAIYALMAPIARLRISLGGLAIQVPLAIFSFAIVLSLQFEQPCPARLGEVCNWLVIKPSGPITPSQASFLVVLVWMISAWMVYKYNVSRAKASSLPTLSRLVDNLVYERRFAEVLMLVEHYLPLIGQAARRRLRMQKVHDHLSRLKSDNLTLHYLFHDREAFEREQVRSALSKKLRHWMGYLELFVPNQNKAENAAKDIVRILFQSEDVRRFITTMRPYSGISLLRLDLHETSYFSYAYFDDLISNTSSVLYQELEQNQNTSLHGGYYFPESNRVLHFLFNDARTAENLQVWKPIGEHILKLLSSDESPAFVASLNKRGEGFECSKNPVWAGIFFFDLMVTAAAYQGVRWHMWLYYLPYFVDRLEELYDTSAPTVNTLDEFPTRSARLIYEAVRSLCSWVRLVQELPDDSPHRQSEIFSHCERRGWECWTNDNGNIPVSAAIALGTCMMTIAMSKRLDDKFAGYIYEVVMRTVKDLRRDSDVGHFRSFLIQSIVNGGQNQFNSNYGRHLAMLKDKVDHVIWDSIDDYQAVFEQTYPNENL